MRFHVQSGAFFILFVCLIGNKTVDAKHDNKWIDPFIILKEVSRALTQLLENCAGGQASEEVEGKYN